MAERIQTGSQSSQDTNPAADMRQRIKEAALANPEIVALAADAWFEGESSIELADGGDRLTIDSEPHPFGIGRILRVTSVIDTMDGYRQMELFVATNNRPNSTYDSVMFSRPGLPNEEDNPAAIEGGNEVLFEMERFQPREQ